MYCFLRKSKIVSSQGNMSDYEAESTYRERAAWGECALM